MRDEKTKKSFSDAHLHFLNGLALSFNCSFIILEISFFLDCVSVNLELPALYFLYFIKQLGIKLTGTAIILGNIHNSRKLTDTLNNKQFMVQKYAKWTE